MRKFLSQLWQDEAGFVISSELIFVATLLVIGLITGLTTIRDQVLVNWATSPMPFRSLISPTRSAP